MNGRGHLASVEPGKHFGGDGEEGVTLGAFVNGRGVVVGVVNGLGHLESVEPGKHFGGGCVNGGKYSGPAVLDTLVVVRVAAGVVALVVGHLISVI